jgi:hypothetical protein
MKLISHLLCTYKKNNLLNGLYLGKIDYYEQLTEPYLNFSEYFRIIDLYQQKEFIPSDRIITIQEDYPFNRSKSTHVIKKLKHSQFKSRIRKDDLDISIYFYKIMIGGHKVRLEIHLSAQKMFYCNYTFTACLNRKQNQDIIKIIQEKYVKDLPIDISTQNIIDTNHTVVSIENSMELKIHYICTQSSCIQTLCSLKKTSENRKMKALKRKHRELINQL